MAAQAQQMDRGSEAMTAHFEGCTNMELRQTRRGWGQEMCGCEARTEFKWFKNGDIGQYQFAESIEESTCCCRFCLAPWHQFRMEAQELHSHAEVLTIDRPCRTRVWCCKCCCYQYAKVSSGGNELGSIQETCFCTVPKFEIRDHNRSAYWILHQPTCCGGCCVNPCAEGNPLGGGWQSVQFGVYPAADAVNDNARPIGTILKNPKSIMTELLTDSVALEVSFPNNATNDQKAVLAAAAVFLNANYFETSRRTRRQNNNRNNNNR